MRTRPDRPRVIGVIEEIGAEVTALATGHHAAVCAQVRPDQTVAVVGDGAVGLSCVLAAKRLGAERIIALSRHAGRQQLATEFGATDIVAERGDAAVEAVKALTDGVMDERRAIKSLVRVGSL